MTVAACWLAIIAGVVELPFMVYEAIHRDSAGMWAFVPIVLLEIAIGIFGVRFIPR